MPERNPRDAVVEAGRDRLLRHALDTLRSQLNASVLAAPAPVSRDTAYRVFRGDTDHPNVTDAIVAAVSHSAHDPSWMGYHDALHATLAAYQAAVPYDSDEERVVTAVKAALQANFESQFSSAGLPVSWVLQASALTTSEAWNGEPPPDEDVALGRAILADRQAFYAEVTEQLTGFLSMVLSDMGRRPRVGIEPATIVKLAHALSDGAVMRCLIEPGALPPALVAESMYLLAHALTEVGPFADPRRPDDERGGARFDRLVESAAALWRKEAEVTLEDVADDADVPLDAACLLFPTVGDLADSLVRARVVGAGFTSMGTLPDDAKVGEHLLALVSELQNLRDLADQLPHLIEATQHHLPRRTTPFVDDFVDNESRVVAALGVTPDPARLVRDLVTFASRGTDGWPTVQALLHTLGV